MICRRTIALFLALLGMASPLLACLPNPSMTPAEMECCKKMAGNCDMGGGNHKCCDVTVNHAAPVAAIVHSSGLHALALPMIVLDARTEIAPPRLVERIISSSVVASPSPPGSPIVLRL